jgi:TonB family protein
MAHSADDSVRLGQRSKARLVVAASLSLAAHVSVVALAAAAFLLRGQVASDVAPRSQRSESFVEIELPIVLDGTAVGELARVDPEGTPLAPGGGERPARPDTGRDGRGGTDTAAARAVNLADRGEALTLEQGALSRVDRSQVQRLSTAQERSSREDWRASRQPTDRTFLALGHGARPERLVPSDHDAAAGARSSAAPSRRGNKPGPRERPSGVGEPARAPASAVLGGALASPGVGLRDGKLGRDHRVSAAVADARPMVHEGVPSIPASARDKPRDTVDSEQEIAAMTRAIVHASTAGGARGPGPGGQQGLGPSGSGGAVGAGSRSSALGMGVGRALDTGLYDARRTDYLRRVMTKVHPLWASAFPRWAALEGRQGTVIIAFTILADGTVRSASVARPSGIAEFDEACRRAVLRGAPYPPLPPELGPELRWAMPFEVRNPAVRPKSP